MFNFFIWAKISGLENHGEGFAGRLHLSLRRQRSGRARSGEKESQNDRQETSGIGGIVVVGGVKFYAGKNLRRSQRQAMVRYDVDESAPVWSARDVSTCGVWREVRLCHNFVRRVEENLPMFDSDDQKYQVKLFSWLVKILKT